MNNKPTSIFIYALANSLLTTLYISFIVTFLSYTPIIFGNSSKSALIPMAMLLLFVSSAALCGSLVFGRPILWYIDGRKKEAVTLFSYTLGMLFILAVLIFTILYFVA